MMFFRTLEAANWSSIHAALTPSPAEEFPVRPLKIVHVITRLVLGGAEENTVATCLHQAACGHQVTLIHGPGADPIWAKRIGDRFRLISIDALVHPISPLADLVTLRDLRQLYRQLKPDIVHTHESKAGIVGRVAAAAARVPLIVHTIHIAPFVAVSGGQRRLYVDTERVCARFTHLLIAVSRGMQQAYLDAGIGGGVPIPVIHSGMPLERFTSAAPPSDWRSRIGGWNGKERPRFILKMAAFEERKRQSPLLRAMAEGLRKRSNACLLFAGDGPDRLRCEEDARALGIADKVRFLGHDPAPWELIALTDLCVHASEREGLPRTAVQAIAGGKPLVVARLPGIEEIVADNINGIITDADDLTMTAAEVFALLDSPDRLARLQHGARSTDVSSWREEMMGERIDRAYASASTGSVAQRPPITTIEFLGLPGSGKTTIARQLLSLLREQRAPVRISRDAMGDELPFLRRSLRRLALLARAFLRSPHAMFFASRGLALHQRGGKDAVKTRWNFLSVLAMQLRQRPNGLLIADQGLAQAIWTARIHHGRDAAPTKSVFDQLDGWIGETLFIHVEAPTAVAQQRLARRRRRTSRFQNAESIADISLWARGKEAIEHIADEIEEELERRRLPGRLLRIPSDGDDTPLDRAKHIRDHLRQLERDDRNVVRS
ncbi:MAG TPA: glycosyltransferase [Sphingobium sp.]|uniref:glycosyltransferase n=1 Tax=Sphingobium sp. TaxID=1912891 RepID=UPI002ED03EBF